MGRGFQCGDDPGGVGVFNVGMIQMGWVFFYGGEDKKNIIIGRREAMKKWGASVVKPFKRHIVGVIFDH